MGDEPVIWLAIILLVGVGVGGLASGLYLLGDNDVPGKDGGMH